MGGGQRQRSWLFGSRARGDARPESDVDIALALVPGDGRTDWALGNYFAFEGDWKRQLKTIVAPHDVSLGVIVPGEDADVCVRREHGGGAAGPPWGYGREGKVWVFSLC